jgi:ABC-type transport system substrate-binding protein
VVQTFQVGNGPDGIAYGGGSIWVANGLDGTVTQIDPRTDTVVAPAIRVGNGPTGIAAGDGYVWIANSDDSTVSRINLTTGRPSGTFAVDGGVDAIAVGNGSVWVTSSTAGTVTRIDARTGNVLYPVRAGGGADAVAVGKNSVWVANYLDGTVTRIDPQTDVAVTIPVADGPSGIVLAGGDVWVSDELAGSLSRIDATTNVSVPAVSTGNRPAGIVLAGDSLFVGVGSSGSSHVGGELKVLASGPGFIPVDPATVSGSLSSQVATLTNDGLTAFRKVGGSAGTELVPDLAVSLPSPTDGGRSYSFQLRPGLRYSDGALVRPEDVRWGIERSLELNRGGSGQYYSGIVGARRCLARPSTRCNLSRGIVADAAADTVTFHLLSADPDFLFKLALPPADAIATGTPLHPHGFVPATGPYEVASFDPRNIRLVRNPEFREWSPAAQPSGFPDAIDIRMRPAETGSAALALTGRVDLAKEVSVSPAEIETLLTRHAAQLAVNPWDITFSLMLNTRLAPFDDVRARRALNFAVDRERLRDLTVGHGLGQITCQVLPPNFDGYRRYCPYTVDPTPTGVWSAPDLTRARALVRASHTAGESVTVWMPPWLPFGAAPARYVVSVLDRLGYRARFRIAHTEAEDPYRIEDRVHLQIGFYGWFPDYASPAGDIPAGFTCDSYNRVNALNQNAAEFCDPVIDREIARAETLGTSEPDQASRMWQRVDRDLTNEAPWVPFANGVALDVKSRRVGNYEYNPQWGTLLDQLWVR